MITKLCKQWIKATKADPLIKKDELLTRYQFVKAEHAKAEKAVQRAKPGSATRMQKARWAGCLLFALLQIKSELVDKGIRIP
jgi:hypothetical protein